MIKLFPLAAITITSLVFGTGGFAATQESKDSKGQEQQEQKLMRDSDPAMQRSVKDSGAPSTMADPDSPATAYNPQPNDGTSTRWSKNKNAPPLNKRLRNFYMGTGDVAAAGDVSDPQLGKSVERALKEDEATRYLNLHADANNGIITLSGTVNSLDKRDLATRVAKGVYGVKSVDNKIDVMK